MERYYIKTDGASRGNPGLSGYGGVIEDEDGKILLEVKGFWAKQQTTKLNTKASHTL